ncbi:MAG: hypothetical protein IJ689_07860 [Alphaproteobacteria bacterium]|nr:hypothetical protein [Alphaproteobacteria bacterium]MBR1649490.1 hypothetical protein [Alphaproteobacteria bacterium]
MKEDVVIGATSNLDAKTAAEKGAEFMENLVKNGGGKLTKGQKRAARKMAKELLRVGRIDRKTYEEILKQIAKQ